MVLSREDIEKEIVAAETSIKTAETIKALSQITLKAFQEELKHHSEVAKNNKT